MLVHRHQKLTAASMTSCSPDWPSNWGSNNRTSHRTSHHVFPTKAVEWDGRAREKAWKSYIRESPICEDLKTSHLDLYCSHFRVIIFHLSLCDVPNSTFRCLEHHLIEQKTLASSLESPDIVDQCSLESHRLPAPMSRSYLLTPRLSTARIDFW